MKSFYNILLLLLSFNSGIALGQTRTVTGTVTDATGPVQGITVVEKGVTANGVTTDAEGSFTITLRSRSNTLLISGAGYLTQEVTISGKTVTVTLQTDARGLEEVVVVGYGTQKKVTKTGAISTVTREEIQRTPSASLQNSLAGKIPGFFSQQRSGMPGRDAAQFFVRGVSTFTGNQQPLILVDDIEYSYDQFSSIDPNEVESLTILKDAATTAVYGIKGANGVILVTTRRGKAGPARINFRTEYGIQKPTHVPKFLDAYQTALLRNEALANEGKPLEFTQQDLELFQSGADLYGHPNINWYNTLFRSSAPMTSNKLDISGGTENVKYFISLGHLWQNGMLRNFNTTDEVNSNYSYNRYNFRSNLDIKATKSLSFRMDISGNYGLRNNPYFDGNSGSGETAAFYEIFNYEFLNPYLYPIYNPDGSFGYTSPQRPAPSNGSNNIIGRITYGGYTRVRQNLLNGNLSAIQKLDVVTKGLSLRGSLSFTGSNSTQRQLIRRIFPSFYYNPTDNSYIPRDPNIYRIDRWSSTYAGGSPARQLNIQANLSYNRSFGKHNVNGLILYNQTTKVAADRNNIVLNDFIPDNFRGYTIRAGYNYAEKYLFEINAGYNGTDKFVSSQRYGLFPAVSVGWNIAKESFVRDHLKFIDLFKIRGSYGIVGSDDIGGYKYAYEETYQRGSGYSFGESHNGVTGVTPGTLGNNDITWEKERKLNAGLDFAFFDGKLSGTADVFDNYRYDILTVRQTIAPYFGIERSSLPAVNIGEVENKGYEVEIGYNGKAGKVGYTIRGNYSYAKNKIVNIDEPNPKYPWQQQTGLPLGMVRQWIFDGFYKDGADINNSAKPPGTVRPGYLKYKDLNEDGKIDVDDKAYVGNPNLQNTNIGITLGLSYKNFSLNALVQSAVNFDMQIGQVLSTPWKANLQPIHQKRWTPKTAETAEFPLLITDFVGSYMTSAEASTFWSVPGDYVRLKSVELSYQLPGKWIKGIGFSSARVYANGYDLLTWSRSFDRFQFDPEVVRGASTGIYPQQAIYNLGVNVSF